MSLKTTSIPSYTVIISTMHDAICRGWINVLIICRNTTQTSQTDRGTHFKYKGFSHRILLTSASFSGDLPNKIGLQVADARILFQEPRLRIASWDCDESRIAHLTHPYLTHPYLTIGIDDLMINFTINSAVIFEYPLIQSSLHHI